MLPRSTATMGKNRKNLWLLALRPLHRPALRQVVLPRVQGGALNTAMGRFCFSFSYTRSMQLGLVNVHEFAVEGKHRGKMQAN